MKASELAAILLENPDAEVFHDDCEWGIAKAQIRLIKLYDVMGVNDDGTFSDAGYKSVLTEEDILNLRGQIVDFPSRDIPAEIAGMKAEVQRHIDAATDEEERDTWTGMLAMYDDHAEILRKDYLRMVETVKRSEAAPLSFVLNGHYEEVK